MKALVKYDKGPGNVALMEMPEPVCKPGQVKLEIAYCGICGTDLHVYHDTFKNFPPVILGHEFVGKVVEKSPEVSHIKIGECYAVLGANAITCGQCYHCQKGEFIFCLHRRGMGHGINGAFTRFAVARPDQLYVLPNHLEIKQGALVEPLAAAVHAVIEVAKVQLGDTVLVSGPGPIGLLCAKLLLRQAIKVILTGTSMDHQRLSLAASLGVHRTVMVDREDLGAIIEDETCGRGVDLAFETAGAQGSVANCLAALRPLGQLVQVGHFGQDLVLPWDHVAFKQLIIKGSVGYTKETWSQTMKILSQGFDATDIVTHEFALDDWQRGFDLCENKEAVKVLIRPE